MEVLQNPNLIALYIVVIVISILGFAIYYQNIHDPTNKTFLGFSICLIGWSATSYISSISQNQTITLILIRISFAFSILYLFFLLHTILTFKNEKMEFPFIYKFGVVPFVILISILLCSPFIVKDIKNFPNYGFVPLVNISFGIIIFTLCILVLITSILITFYRKLKFSKLPNTSRHIILFFLFTAFISKIIFNLVLPALFDNTEYIPFGYIMNIPIIFIVSLIIFSSNNRILNLRLAIIHIAFFVLVLVQILNVIKSNSFNIILYHSSILLIILMLGLMLTKMIIKYHKVERQFLVLHEDFEKRKKMVYRNDNVD